MDRSKLLLALAKHAASRSTQTQRTGDEMTYLKIARYWVGVVSWNDGSAHDIEIMGVFSRYETAFAAVHAYLVAEAQVVMGSVGSGQRSGTVEDSGVTWDWVVEPVEGIQP